MKKYFLLSIIIFIIILFAFPIKITDNLCETKNFHTVTITTTRKLKKVQPSIQKPIEINGFILLKALDNDFVIDLKYASTDNFTKQKVYQTNICVLRKPTALKLASANNEFKKMGYTIKIWDAYRPISVQKVFWGLVPDERYVCNPYNGGSIHNKGCAVDITLVDKNGIELEMPSGFDNFTQSAYRENTSMTKIARANLDMLTKVMTKCGFTTINTEWWHYNDADSANYKVEDIDLNLFK